MKDIFFCVVALILGIAIGAHLTDTRTPAQRAFTECVSVEHANAADCAAAVKDIYR